jgi:hypothetical protein
MTERRTPGFYGARVESWVLSRYGLERSYREVESGVRLDAIEPESGRPVETKAVGRNRDGGRATGSSFKVWKDQHRVIRDSGGYYVFVLYDLLPNGIGVVDSRAVEADNLSLDWYGETQPRGARQAEIPAREVFHD